MSEDDNKKEAGSRRKAKGFFALDVNQFERIQTLNLGLEEAATYLCLLEHRPKQRHLGWRHQLHS